MYMPLHYLKILSVYLSIKKTKLPYFSNFETNTTFSFERGHLSNIFTTPLNHSTAEAKNVLTFINFLYNTFFKKINQTENRMRILKPFPP